MKVLDIKIPKLTAISTAETVFPPTVIEDTARKFIGQGKSAANLITSVFKSKISSKEKEIQVFQGESLFPQNMDMESMIYSWANDPTTSTNLLDNLSITSVVSILVSVAGNKNISNASLQRLANHYNPEVRAAVIENPKIPFQTLVALSNDEHPDVRFAMAENYNVPKLLLKKLAVDDNPYIACRAHATLKQLA